MRYKTQPGIVLKSICDEHLLIATGPAREVCPAMKVINETAAYYWRLLAAGKSTEEMVAAAAADYSVSAEEIAPGVQAYLEMLSSQHYVFPEEE